MTRKILFVCTGNICRSPLAEAILRHKITMAGRAEEFLIDSAGTHGYHIGELPDPRTLKIANIKQVSTEGIRARQVKMSDFEAFDLIFGMDDGHVRHLKNMASPEYHPKIHLFLEYATGRLEDVADPYYGDFAGFERMFEVIDEVIDKTTEKLI